MSGSDGSDYRDRFVTLGGGLIVPAPAYLLLLDLERRAFTVTRDSDTTLIVRPADQLTDADRAAIRRWKFHLIGLLTYCARSDNDAHLFADTPSAPLRTA